MTTPDPREQLRKYKVMNRYWNEDHAVWMHDTPAAFEALEKVLELHPSDGHEELPECIECGGTFERSYPYPCPTVQAISRALQGGA